VYVCVWSLGYIEYQLCVLIGLLHRRSKP
jgi:hypothetical protein